MSVLAINPIVPKSYIVRIISVWRYESSIVPEPGSRESRPTPGFEVRRPKTTREDTTVKRTMSSILILGVVISLSLVGALFRGGRSGIVPQVHAQEKEENGSCSVATLKGAYGFFRTGTVPAGALAAVGIATFDGTGAVGAARQTIRKNGITTQDLFTGPNLAGPYEVDPDCAARFLNPDGSVFAHAVVVAGGNELFILSLSDSNSVYGVMKKIDRKD
jgi:hypothetical protein